MIEVADSNAVYYYHYDALGSVVALSDSSGDTVQTYQYSVYGQVAVEDINHPNPYMFAGRRFEIEIGLYYNRARYYNPFTGRFLQADPIGYEAGMNLYAYCGNSPLGLTDPSGCKPYDPCDPCDPCDGISDWLDLYYSKPWRGDNVINYCQTTGNALVLPSVYKAPESLPDMRRLAKVWGEYGLFFNFFDQFNLYNGLGDVIKGIADGIEGSIKTATNNGQYKWHAYILIQDYQWQVVGLVWKEFKPVPVGQPYWVEIRGFAGWSDPTFQYGDLSDYEGYSSPYTGYNSEKQAIEAAYNAGALYYHKGIGPSPPHVDGEWLHLETSGWCPRHRKYGCNH